MSAVDEINSYGKSKNCFCVYRVWKRVRAVAGTVRLLKAWNTLSQINLGSSSSPAAKADFRQRSGYAGQNTGVQNLSEINLESMPRLPTSIGELDRVLGGGLVPGSVVLIGGNPGAGKSTLLLQVMCLLSSLEKGGLYVTGEESLQQVGMRSQRLKLPQDNLKMLAETNV